MEHIKQADDECFPTVLAMLTGVDVNKILADTQALSPVAHSWTDYLNSSNDIEKQEEIANTYRSLCRKYAPYLIDAPAIGSFIKVTDCIEKSLYLKYDTFMLFIKSFRRGAIISCSRFKSIPGAHIAAFESGLVYDGNLDGPILAHEYYKKLAKDTPLCPIAVVSEY
jgi:hypothetical protein